MFGDRIVGGDWKFSDYASSLNRPLLTRRIGDVADLRHMERDLDFTYGAGVRQLKDAAMSAFRQLNL